VSTPLLVIKLYDFRLHCILINSCNFIHSLECMRLWSVVHELHAGMTVPAFLRVIRSFVVSIVFQSVPTMISLLSVSKLSANGMEVSQF
jgi:hypothetical protein